MTALDSDDDYDYTDSHSSPPIVRSSMRTPLLNSERQLCQYNPCLENQQPCALLAEETGCLCPGMSGDDKPPHPPRIEALLPVNEGKDKGKIEVRWCAPSSVVSSYRVVVEGLDDGVQEYGNALRRGVVGSLEVGTKVCVEAVNTAGQSASSEFSCKRYDAPQYSDQKLLAWVIGGGVALLLLFVILGVILWRCHICRKAKRDSADGLGNPSYTTEGTL